MPPVSKERTAVTPCQFIRFQQRVCSNPSLSLAVWLGLEELNLISYHHRFLTYFNFCIHFSKPFEITASRGLIISTSVVTAPEADRQHTSGRNIQHALLCFSKHLFRLHTQRRLDGFCILPFTTTVPWFLKSLSCLVKQEIQKLS